MKKLLLALILMALLAGQVWAGTVTPTTATTFGGQNQTRTVTWAHLNTTNASGAAANFRSCHSISFWVSGTWNGATFALQGSNDGTNYVALRALSSLTAISQTVDSTVISVVFEAPVAWVKPVLTGAGASTDLTCVVVGAD